MSESFNPESIPRGSDRQIKPGDYLCVITAQLADTTHAAGVRPGLISARWGRRLFSPRRTPQMRPELLSDVVYDGPPYDSSTDFLMRDPPYYAPFSRDDDRVRTHPLGHGGRLVASRYRFPPKHLETLNATPQPEPPYSEMLCHTVSTVVRAGESGFEGLDVTEARLTLQALTLAVTPDDPEAAHWSLQQLLPKQSDAGS